MFFNTGEKADVPLVTITAVFPDTEMSLAVPAGIGAAVLVSWAITKIEITTSYN